MQLHSTQLTGLIGSILLSAGLATPVALADEASEKSDPVEQIELVEGEPESDQLAESSESVDEADEKSSDPEMIQVRISMPDGRTIIRMEPAQQSSARRTIGSAGPSSRTLADGSRISYGTSGVSGGSSSSSIRTGGGGGGGSSSSGGGGGSSGGSSALIDSSAENESSTDDSNTGENLAGSTPTTFLGSNSSDSSDSSETSGGSDPSSSSSSTTATTTTVTTAPHAVHTIGNPDYNDDGAFGGQRVEFHDAGISAAVIGNTVYFIGVELVQANQEFDIVDGTRLGSDSAMMLSGYIPSGSDLMSSWNTAASPIKLDFESDTVVELVMLSEPADTSNPERIQRTWTVRIR